ncbi:MAG: ATP synthase F1 subunit epsilon [Rhodospirillales bacterium]|jgi:F-type H+-transporting ATPase subunit epsilon|tara:strand:+ start:1928 stop:2326 length:399 start_codon:yes stop_codon:yes gene_type:complete
MADTVEFELVSPAKLLKSEPVEMVVVPGAEGDLGVLPGHSALIATVRPGVIDIHEGGSVKERIFVAGGFCEISPERCTVLAEEAIEVSAIDKVAAQKRLEDATLAWKNADDANKAKAEAERRIAEAMVAAAV